jgi:hypothetical protein
MLRYLIAAALVLCAAACEQKKTRSEELADSAAAAQSARAPSPSATSGPRVFAVIPDMFVDELSISIAGERIDLAVPTGRGKLKETTAAMPVSGKRASFRTVTKAKTPDVAALVWALGEAGASEIAVKMPGGRSDLPDEIVLLPEQRLAKPEPCSVVASVLDDLSTGVWPFKGGGGKRARKGYAGPDLTIAGDHLTEALEQCDSKAAFFSANPKLRWEHAFHIGALIVKSDSKKRIDKLVLLGEEPVAGRPVKLRQ